MSALTRETVENPCKTGKPPAQTDAQTAHAKTSIEAEHETVSGMAAILGVNRSTLQRALSSEPSEGRINS